ncbi:MAG: hypothetical protein LUH10_10335 [Tannerellaceae bacterium]|nr:hypothetical protein [Tannerellaceae bacterium]
MTKQKLNEVSIITELGNNDYIPVILSDGSIGRILKSKLLLFTGAETSIVKTAELGWYRIATCSMNAYISSGIFNIGNIFNNSVSGSVCFYLSGSGYGNRSVNIIGKNEPSLISKVRFIYKKSTAEPLFVDIYYKTSSRNDVNVSLSSALNIRLQTPQAVSEEIPSDYSIEEFVL